jgi:hypothetical protein
MDNKVWQEFYCNDCQGYFTVKINLALSCRIKLECPNCKHQHPRVVKDGKIFEHAEGVPNYEEVIVTTKSNYSKEPKHAKIKRDARNGEVFDSADSARDAYMRELWIEIHGGKD